MTLKLPDGDYDTFTNICGYTANIKHLAIQEIPDDLPDGYKYSDSMEVTLLDSNKNSVSILPGYGSSTISYLVDPKTLGKAEYSILFWDENFNDSIGGWIKLPLLPDNSKTDDFYQLLHPDSPSDQRTITVPVYEFGKSRIQVTTNFTGIFILVESK